MRTAKESWPFGPKIATRPEPAVPAQRWRGPQVVIYAACAAKADPFLTFLHGEHDAREGAVAQAAVKRNPRMNSYYGLTSGG